jgi:hypothetical protein
VEKVADRAVVDHQVAPAGQLAAPCIVIKAAQEQQDKAIVVVTEITSEVVSTMQVVAVAVLDKMVETQPHMQQAPAETDWYLQFQDHLLATQVVVVALLIICRVPAHLLLVVVDLVVAATAPLAEPQISVQLVQQILVVVVVLE